MKITGLSACVLLLAITSVHAQIPPQLLQLLPDTRQRNVDDDAVLGRYRKALLAEFEQRLDQPDVYVRRVKAECRDFPEGDLFPYLLPVYAYASLAERGEVDPSHAQQRIAQLIELARPAVIARLKPPLGDLMKLNSYRDNATYLGQFMLALCAYRLVGGDDRYDALRTHLADLFTQALTTRPDYPALYSFPHLIWTFDTIPVLAALHWHDRLTGQTTHQTVIDNTLQWLDKNFMSTESPRLPDSTIKTSPHGTGPIARGCDLSWRIALLTQFDPERARSLYENYTQAFWLDRGFIAGFREYRPPLTGGSDRDSGPIIADVGGTASTLGIATTIAMHDQSRLHRLCQQLDALPQFLPLTVLPGNPPRIAGMLPYDKQYHTGFLYGDLTLFYAVTWSEWKFAK